MQQIIQPLQELIMLAVNLLQEERSANHDRAVALANKFLYYSNNITFSVFYFCILSFHTVLN